jgi:hypothetical protein
MGTERRQPTTSLSCFVASKAAFAQAGSTGGTIGKTNKSVSDDQEEKTPAGANTAPTKTAPKVLPAHTQTGPCGPIVGTWLWYNGVTVKVNSNNTTTQSDGNSATVVCADGTYSFTWFGIHTVRMTLSSDGKRLSGTSIIGAESAVRQ